MCLKSSQAAYTSHGKKLITLKKKNNKLYIQQTINIHQLGYRAKSADETQIKDSFPLVTTFAVLFFKRKTDEVVISSEKQLVRLFSFDN